MMMESCTGLGMFFGILGMAAPLIAIGAIFYLIFAKSKHSDLQEVR